MIGGRRVSDRDARELGSTLCLGCTESHKDALFKYAHTSSKVTISK